MRSLKKKIAVFLVCLSTCIASSGISVFASENNADYGNKKFTACPVPRSSGDESDEEFIKFIENEYNISRNENWKISVNGLVTQIKGGRDLVLSTVKELKDNGYLYIMQGRNENGSFGITKWYIFESPEDNPFFLKEDDMPESENPSTVENTAVGKSEYGQKTPQSENPHTGKSATAVGKPEYGQKPLNSPQSENPNTENPTQTKIERKIERYKKENLSKEKRNSSASSVIGKIQSQIGFEFLLKEHPEDEQLLRLISRVIAEKLLSEDASITSKNFKYSSDEVHECFETLDFNHIEYLLECLKKNPKKEIRNMKQYLLVTLMNVQANYEGAKLNKHKSDEEEMAEEKQDEEKANVANDVVTSSVSEILKHQGQQNEMNLRMLIGKLHFKHAKIL